MAKKMRENTQTYDVLQYMKTHPQGITSIQAIEKFGATRLSDIIYRLKNTYGYAIDSDDVEVKNRYGRTVTVSQYYLIDV